MLLRGQVLSKLATAMWNAAADDYTARAAARLQAQGQRLIELLDDLDELLATNRWPSCSPHRAFRLSVAEPHPRQPHINDLCRKAADSSLA